jgi:hypothetical protein
MLSVLLYALWLVSPALQSVVGYRMWIRRLNRDYPLFFVYVAYHVVSFPVVLFCYHLGIRDVYRHVYLGLEGVDVALKLGVICELFFQVFRQYEGIREFGYALLRWASVILLMIAVIVAASASGSDSDRFLAGLFAMERSVEIVQGGLLFLLFVLSSSLGLQWKQETLGIALGFGVITSVNLAAFTLRAQLGMTSHDILSLISSAGYDCAVLIWLGTLYARKPVHQFNQRIPRWDVEAWNHALEGLLRR